MLMMMRQDNVKFPKGIDLKITDVPKDLQITTELEVKLPQDKLQLANIAQILKQAGLVDDEWMLLCQEAKAGCSGWDRSTSVWSASSRL